MVVHAVIRLLPFAMTFCVSRWKLIRLIFSLGLQGAVLGLGLNVLLPKQEELLRRRTLAEDGAPCRFNPRWFTNVALSMPYGTQPSVIKSVLPTTGSPSSPGSRRRDSVTWDLTSSSNTSYESETDSEASSAEHNVNLPQNTEPFKKVCQSNSQKKFEDVYLANSSESQF